MFASASRFAINFVIFAILLCLSCLGLAVPAVPTALVSLLALMAFPANLTALFNNPYPETSLADWIYYRLVNQGLYMIRIAVPLGLAWTVLDHHPAHWFGLAAALPGAIWVGQYVMRGRFRDEPLFGFATPSSFILAGMGGTRLFTGEWYAWSWAEIGLGLATLAILVWVREPVAGRVLAPQAQVATA